MGILRAKILGDTLKKIGLGILDATPLAGIKNNIEGSTAPKGQVDWLRMGVFVVTFTIIIAVIFGGIDLETAKELIDIAK